MNPSDTPRSDEAELERFSSDRTGITAVVSINFARQLERELNAQIEANRILNLGVQQATKKP